MPDPTDPRAVAAQPALGYDTDCPECSGTGQRDSGGTHPWGEPAMMMCDCDAPPPAAPTDNTALVDVLASLAAAISLLERGGKKAAPSDKMFEQMLIDYRASLERGRTAALASREAPPAAQEPDRNDFSTARAEGMEPKCNEAPRPTGWFEFDENTGEFTGHWCSVKPHDARGFRPLYAAPPPACQQEAVTVAEASHRLIVGFMLDCNVIGHVAAAENLVRGIKDHVAALRALKGEQK